jgi:predicted ArsR family transcriptional regulator
MTYEHDKSGDKSAVAIISEGQKITARQAADIIGISIHAVRKRLQKVARTGTTSIDVVNLAAGRTA